MNSNELNVNQESGQGERWGFDGIGDKPIITAGQQWKNLTMVSIQCNEKEEEDEDKDDEEDERDWKWKEWENERFEDSFAESNFLTSILSTSS